MATQESTSKYTDGEMTNTGMCWKTCASCKKTHDVISHNRWCINCCDIQKHIESWCPCGQYHDISLFDSDGGYAYCYSCHKVVGSIRCHVLKGDTCDRQNILYQK